MNDILYAFYMTVELWGFIGILLTALAIEAIIMKLKQRSEPNV